MGPAGRGPDIAVAQWPQCLSRIGGPCAAGLFGYGLAVFAGAYPEFDDSVGIGGGQRHLLRGLRGAVLALGVVAGFCEHAVDLQLEDRRSAVAPVVIEEEKVAVSVEVGGGGEVRGPGRAGRLAEPCRRG